MSRETFSGYVVLCYGGAGTITQERDVRKAVGAETASQTMFTTGWGSYLVVNNLAEGGADRSAIEDYYDEFERKVKGGWPEKTKWRKCLSLQTLAPFLGHWETVFRIPDSQFSRPL